MLAIALRHMAMVGLTMSSLWLFDANPRVLAYVFLLLVWIRLLTVKWLIQVKATGRPGCVATHWRKFSSPPPSGSPMTWETGDSREPVGFGGYMFMNAVYALFIVLMVNADAEGEFGVGWSEFGLEVVTAAGLALIYGMEELFGGAVLFNAEAPDWMNYGHNIGMRMVLMHLALGVCGVLLVLVQRELREPNGWLFFGPLLALKHLIDFFSDVGACRRRKLATAPRLGE